MRLKRFRNFLAITVAFAAAVSPSFSQPAPKGGDSGLRQKLERATGKPLTPPMLRQVRQAQLDFVARCEESEKKTAEDIAGAVGASATDVPPVPRPGLPALSDGGYLQALERKMGKPLTDAQKSAVVAALLAHRDEVHRSVDHYVRDLTSAVPRLTKEQAEEVLAPLVGPKG